MGELTHFNEQGRAKMVDVTEKAVTHRRAVAAGEIHMAPETLQKIKDGTMKKGDVLAVAQVAGIQAAKHNWELIPMCHPLPLTGIDITFALTDEPCMVEIQAAVTCTGVTGVEMEALTAVSVAALTIYDMCKAVQKDMRIENIRLLEKSGVLFLRIALVLCVVSCADLLIDGLQRIVADVDHAANSGTCRCFFRSVGNFPCHLSHIAAHFSKLISKIHVDFLPRRLPAAASVSICGKTPPAFRHICTRCRMPLRRHSPVIL